MSAQHPAANRLGRREQAETLRDYFDIQLRFAEAVSQAATLPLTQTLRQCTDFHRRFGLGQPPGNVVKSKWKEYGDQLLALDTHEQRLRWTQAFFAQSSPGRASSKYQRFGCFSFELPDGGGVVQIHFTNRETKGISPLSHSQIEARQRELSVMFTHVHQTHPNAQEVHGASWLYNIEAYRRLFPPAYGDSREVLKETMSFRGTSSWGQFLDYREQVKPALRDQFLKNLQTIDAHVLWKTFPLPKCSAQAPVELFYDFYGVGQETV